MKRTNFSRLSDWIGEFLISKGLLKGSKNYQKFIILNDYRTGSNFLMNLLKAHPKVICYSEVLFHNKIFWGYKIYGKDDDDNSLFEERNRDILKFLDKYIYRKYPARKKAVGFKFMYGDLFENKTIDLEAFLDRNQDVLVIHLTREDLLAQMISGIIFQKTKDSVVVNDSQWNKKLGSIEPFKLTEEFCENFFSNKENRINSIEIIVRAKKVNSLSVTYEGLANNRVETLKTIQNRLGLNFYETKTIQKKQNRLSHRDWITNYDELKSHFAGSKWSKYFTQ